MPQIRNGRIVKDRSYVLSEAFYRKAFAVAMIAALYTSIYATHFQPFSWVLSQNSGLNFLDRMLAPVSVFGAFLSQWQIASRILHAPVEIPVLTEEFGVLYQTKDFWTAGRMERVALAAAMTAGNTLLGRALAAVVLAGL